jgi:hypothetical protein
MVLARPDVRSTTKIDSKNSLYPLRHFTEHMVNVFRKLPWKNDLDHESSSLFDPVAQEHYRHKFLQQSTSHTSKNPHQKSDSRTPITSRRTRRKEASAALPGRLGARHAGQAGTETSGRQ